MKIKKEQLMEIHEFLNQIKPNKRIAFLKQAKNICEKFIKMYESELEVFGEIK